MGGAEKVATLRGAIALLRWRGGGYYFVIIIIIDEVAQALQNTGSQNSSVKGVTR